MGYPALRIAAASFCLAKDTADSLTLDARKTCIKGNALKNTRKFLNIL